MNVLVNNAGTYEFAPLESITPEYIQRHFNLNVTGLRLTTKEAVKLMGSDGGSIVDIGSIVGSMPAPQASAYSASEAAINAITVSLSQELGPRKSRVNSLNPGVVETEGLRASGLHEREFRGQQRENDTARPDRHAGRHRPGRYVSSQRRRALDHGASDCGRRRQTDVMFLDEFEKSDCSFAHGGGHA